MFAASMRLYYNYDFFQLNITFFACSGQVRNFGVVIGVVDLPLSGSSIPSSNIIPAASITIHNQYDDANLSNDIAVISESSISHITKASVC